MFRFFLAYCCLISLRFFNLLYFHTDSILIEYIYVYIRYTYICIYINIYIYIYIYIFFFSPLHYVLLCKDALSWLSDFVPAISAF